MAVDTAQKRLSCLTIGQVYMPGLVPDGTIDSGDRQAIAFNYSGVAAQTLTAAVGGASTVPIWIYYLDQFD